MASGGDETNRSPLGYHAGGYTRFYFDATEKVCNGNNLLSVRVSNAYNPDIPPLSADFTFFGGIYRPAYLTILPKHHILPDGITICTSEVSEKSAVVEVRRPHFPKMPSVACVIAWSALQVILCG